MATHSDILAWEIHRQRSLVGYSMWGHREMGITEHTHTGDTKRNKYPKCPARISSRQESKMERLANGNLLSSF